MVAQQDNQTTTKGGKGALITCFVLFSLYFINVLLGKMAVSYGLNLPHLGSVAEFLLLSVACVLLIVAALKRESAEKNLQPRQEETKK